MSFIIKWNIMMKLKMNQMSYIYQHGLNNLKNVTALKQKQVQKY